MVKNTELRIGNLVTWNDDEDIYPLKITGVTDGEDLWIELSDGDTTDTSYESLRPIPLTAEILEKFGFIKNKSHDKIFHKSKWRVKIYEGKSGNKFYRSGELLRDGVSSLHQLQNLYFALTGTELTITL